MRQQSSTVLTVDNLVVQVVSANAGLIEDDLVNRGLPSRSMNELKSVRIMGDLRSFIHMIHSSGQTLRSS